MKLPSGSAVERGMSCAASCVLDRAGHSGAGAAYGAEQHEAIEAGDRSRPVVARVLEEAEEVRHEVSYALDVESRTVRELGVNLKRNYGFLADCEIALTIDVEFHKAGVWQVGDWKSRARVAAVASNWQIRCGAIAVATRHKADTVVGFLAYLDDSELDADTFDAFHIAGWWDELNVMLKRIRAAEAIVKRGETPEVNAGSWCQYCPALPYCPAHTRLALSMLGELEGVDSAMASLSVDQCGRAWELLKRYDVIADRVRDTIRTRAKKETVPLSNGRRLALVECSRKSLDTKKAAEMLGEDAPFKTTTYTQVKELKQPKEDAVDG